MAHNSDPGPKLRKTARIFLVSAMIAGTGTFLYGLFLGPLYKCDDCSPFAQAVVASLRDHPEDWTENPYHLYHKRWDLSFWIASGASFMTPDQLRDNPDAWDSGPGIASREQRYVWTAYRAWHDATDKPLTLSKFRMREKELP